MKIDPVSGQLLQRINFEGLADNITSVAFGGSDLKVGKNLKVKTSGMDPGPGQMTERPINFTKNKNKKWNALSKIEP